MFLGKFPNYFWLRVLNHSASQIWCYFSLRLIRNVLRPCSKSSLTLILTAWRGKNSNRNPLMIIRRRYFHTIDCLKWNILATILLMMEKSRWTLSLFSGSTIFNHVDSCRTRWMRVCFQNSWKVNVLFGCWFFFSEHSCSKWKYIMNRSYSLFVIFFPSSLVGKLSCDQK